jgi:hypothetical protein
MESLSPQRANIRATISARQPVSCEPCRYRKIKCSRNRPICDTCRRRGCVDRCVYRGARDGDLAAIGNSSNEELLERIGNLEELLRKHTGAVIPVRQEGGDVTSSIPSPPVEQVHTSQLSPESFITDSSSNRTFVSDHPWSRSQGVLTSTPSGDVRYELRSSQWTSVLANTHLSISTPSLDDQDESGIASGFPFSSDGPVSVDDLLSLLPPMQQCDYLKNQYFTVFSPVISTSSLSYTY